MYEADPDLQAQRETMQQTAATGMRAFSQTSVLEKIMMYFATRTVRNQDMKSRIRKQFEAMLEQ